MPTTPVYGLPYPAPSDTPDVPYYMQQLAEGVEDTFGQWTTYTPVVGGTSWSLGNGTITGRYCRIGKTVFFRIKMVFGSTTTKGTGSTQLTLSLPSTSHADVNEFTRGSYLDASPVARGALDGLIVAGSAAVSMYANAMTSALTSTAPITWATSDEIYIGGTYEEA